MPALKASLPCSPVEPVTEVLHGVAITDPYRWLEEQNSPRTRTWLTQQAGYMRAYMNGVLGTEYIRERVREFLTVEIFDSLQKCGSRYFFRKRLPDQEQPCIYMREGSDGEDQLLIDPSKRGTGPFTSVKPLRVSPNGGLLLYEVKQGGERTGVFELLDVESRSALPDALPCGLLRGFTFTPDGCSFYYVHEAVGSSGSQNPTVFRHLLGSPYSEDSTVFEARRGGQTRLFLISGTQGFGICARSQYDKISTDFYVAWFANGGVPQPVLSDAEYLFEPILLDNRILALTDREAPNCRIVEVCGSAEQERSLKELVPEIDTPIRQWAIAGRNVFVLYTRHTGSEVQVYDTTGRRREDLPIRSGETIRLVGPVLSDELFLEAQSFIEPITLSRYMPETKSTTVWAKRKIPSRADLFRYKRVWYTSKDGTSVPMFLVGRADVLESGPRPTLMTAYGGYGADMTPKFSVLVTLLLEKGCLFAVPNIRGGLELGKAWHDAGKRRNRQNAYDDFLCAAEWLIETRRATPQGLAIFGGSNAGLLVAAALTQRPELFRAVLCMVPLMDMLRYHKFDEARIWKEEFGSVEDPEDFAALAGYSPYHQVVNGASYPATMIISGDADGSCNPMHARKMTARLQNANTSTHPIILDYECFRGHSPVLPLSERVNALTARIAFLCDQLQLAPQ